MSCDGRPITTTTTAVLDVPSFLFSVSFTLRACCPHRTCIKSFMQLQDTPSISST
jgi:hypothetical protein